MASGNKTYPENERDYLESLDVEIERHLEEVQRLQNIKNIILNKPPEILKKQKSEKAPSKIEINRSNYPMSGERQSKVLAILKMKGKVLLQREIEDKIRDNEGALAKDTLKSFYYVLNDKMLKLGMVAFLRVADSYKYAFYALPEWLDENKRIKPEYLPDESSWANFPLNKRKKMETDKWKYYPMK